VLLKGLNPHVQLMPATVAIVTDDPLDECFVPA
jgi:hypothetical protein